jgi:protein-L-isoaspartate O-methyltransferase
MFKYPSTATERFDNAKLWINYTVTIIKIYIKKNVLEVGAGCGSLTSNYLNLIENVTLTEADNKNFKDLKKKFHNYKNIKIIKSDNVKKIKGSFDTIIYFNVLEHIKKDNTEIANAAKKLKKNGYLIFLVPAHQSLYGNLDKMAGHHRRYDINFFNKKRVNLEIIANKYLDSLGYFLYFLNRFFFKKEIFPSKFKIFLWDKIFVPITIIVDFLIFYKFGKNILCIYKKI